MTSDRRSSRYDHYNVEKLEAKIFTAMVGNETTVYVQKRLAKIAKQMLKVKGLGNDIKIKTY